MKLVPAITLISELLLIGLSQSQLDLIPSDLLSIFIQLPLIGLFIWYIRGDRKETRDWINELLKEKDDQYAREVETLKKQCDRIVDLFEKIIDRQDLRLEKLIMSLASMEKTLTLNTATVSESIRLSELVEELKK